MKTKIIYFVFATIILGALGIYVSSNSNIKELTKEDAEHPEIPVNELFVPIHADTLDFYLKKYFSRGNLKTKMQRNMYQIEYNRNALILLHANNNKMVEARNTLETTKIEGFSIKYTKEVVQISMEKKGNYVDCPALIVAEILRKSNEQ